MTPSLPVSSKSHLKLCVQYVVPKSELNDFIADVGKYGRFVDNSKFRNNRVSAAGIFRRREARLRGLLGHVPVGWRRLGGLHMGLRRRHAYGKCFQTFRRDVMELGLRGLVETRVERGGPNGCTTFIKMKTES